MQVVLGSDTGKHQDRLQTAFDTCDDIRFHPIPNHRSIFSMCTKEVQSRPHHKGVRLSDEHGAYTGRFLN